MFTRAQPLDPPRIYFPDRSALRSWLARNHATHGPIWLVYDKKAARVKNALTYDQLVEEALCFGWIDSVAGAVSRTRSRVYFSPRRAGSVWSALNKRRVASLEARGLIEPPGRAKIDAAKADGSWTALDAYESLEVPDDLGRALDERPPARRCFDAFPPGVRKRILAWIGSAKRPRTRLARIEQAADLARQDLRALDRPRPPAGEGRGR